MTSINFCYWLQGYFEIEGNQPQPPEFCESLNQEQLKVIKDHLKLVFQSETPTIIAKGGSGGTVGEGGGGATRQHFPIVPNPLTPPYTVTC